MILAECRRREGQESNAKDALGVVLDRNNVAFGLTRWVQRTATTGKHIRDSFLVRGSQLWVLEGTGA